MSTWILILILAFCTCTYPTYSPKAEFTVINRTTKLIDSIVVHPDNSKTKNSISLLPNESKHVVIDLSGLSDGAYGITYRIDSSTKSQVFGYFSNGLSMEKFHSITIQSDSVIYRAENH